jgi:ribosomal protein S18 acetylase RimI-like enzyme
MYLQEATEADVPLIIEIEHRPEFQEYIGRWTSAEHAAAMRDPDTRYFLAMNDVSGPAGYVILRGPQSEHRNFELKRVAMRSPGRGHGRQVLQLLLEKVFHNFGAHRLWLDVFETNLRAQHLYSSLGFQQDGTFREAVYRDGQYHSLLLMSLLDREYRATE